MKKTSVPPLSPSKRGASPPVDIESNDEYIPSTPNEIKKFRKQTDPGKKIVHPGAANDRVSTPPRGFGEKHQSDDLSVEDSLKYYKSSWQKEEAEKTENMSIGKSSTTYQLPPNQKNNTFGVKTAKLDGDSVSEALAYKDDSESSAVAGNNISYPIDTFGSRPILVTDSAKDALIWNKPETASPSRRPRNSQGIPIQDVVRSPKVQRNDEASAKDAFSWPQSLSDTNNKTANSSNGTRFEGVTFGKPTMLARQSLSRIGHRKGAEPHSIFKNDGPRHLSQEEEWVRVRTKPEIKDILSSASLDVPDEEFEEAYESLVVNGEKLCMDSFNKALLEVKARNLSVAN